MNVLQCKLRRMTPAKSRRPGRATTPKKPGRAAPSVLTTMRLRSAVHERLKGWAARTRRSVSETAQELIEEGIRMSECPGIYFATEPSGRTAKIGGTGLGVWEVLMDFVKDNDVDRLHRAFDFLSRPQITAALMYFSRYPDEIRRQVQANDELTPEELERRHPGLVKVVRVER